MADSPADQELADRSAAYLEIGNAHEVDRLGEFVAPDVRVAGVPTGLPAGYAWRDGLIAEVWSVADGLEVRQRLSDDVPG